MANNGTQPLNNSSLNGTQPLNNSSLNGTQPLNNSSLNGTPKINTPRLNQLVAPSLNVANLSRRLNTLKRKSPNQNNQNNQNNQKNQNNQNNQKTPMKRPALASGPGLSSEERQRRYARSKNQVVFWRAHPETGEAEMIKEKAKVGGRRSHKARKARKSQKVRKSHKARH